MAKRASRTDIEAGVGASLADIFGSANDAQVAPPPQRRQRRQSNSNDPELVQRYGKTPPWRLPPDLIQAVRAAADEHQVRPKDLVEYVLRVSLVGLANGKLQLPFDEATTTRSVAPGPDIPSDFGD